MVSLLLKDSSGSALFSFLRRVSLLRLLVPERALGLLLPLSALLTALPLSESSSSEEGS